MVVVMMVVVVVGWRRRCGGDNSRLRSVGRRQLLLSHLVTLGTPPNHDSAALELIDARGMAPLQPGGQANTKSFLNVLNKNGNLAACL
jgi:hypothetical protein